MTRYIRPSLAALAATTLLVQGCTNLKAPEYARPGVDIPATYRGQVTPAEAASFADLPWWSAFQDPQLQRLISDGVANNYDLQVAAARIEQARATVGVVSSQKAPQVDYRVGAGGSRDIAAGPRDATAVTNGRIGGFIDIAWELDLWGRIRHSTEAAQARLFQEEEVRRGILLTLTSDIASGYFRLLTLDAELAIAQESTQTYKSTYDLFNVRFEGGRDSALPSQRANATYNASMARVAELKQQIEQQENAISILLGQSPRAIPRGRLADQQLPASPLGAPADILQRRPDIRAAEQGMMSANAEIGVAVANFFPRVGLSAFFGAQGLVVSGDAGAFPLWSAGLSAAGPIFNGGRLQSIYENRKAFWDQTVAQYRKTVMIAFQETADALAAQRNLVDQRAALEAQVGNLRQSSNLALTRFDGGRASYFEVLEAQQELYPAADRLVATRGDQLQATVALYKALGGGWKQTPEEWRRQTP